MSVGMTRILVGLGATLAFVPVFAVAPQNSRDADVAVQEFGRRIAAYARVSERGAAGLSPVESPKTPSAIVKRRAALSSAIKAARPKARQGDIFTADAAPAFRSIIAAALQGRDAEAMLRQLFHEHPGTVGLRLRVHDPYPASATHEMPAVLLQHLPALPDGVEYRLVDHDLILLDIHAGLIVDVLPNAIRRSES
jgi:hypothetical protein